MSKKVYRLTLKILLEEEEDSSIEQKVHLALNIATPLMYTQDGKNPLASVQRDKEPLSEEELNALFSRA